MPSAARLVNLSKTYKSGNLLSRKKVQALKPLDLELPEGGVFGLLGLNGAGKTTTVKLMLGLLKPTTGYTEILGGDISDRSIRRQIGYLPELPYFSRQLTAYETLSYFGSLFGWSGATLRKKVDRILELVRLEAAAHQKVSEYSKGMQQRLGIGQALIGEPKLFLCDEPMSGLDPVGNREMREIFLDLKRTGTTIFMNTHILDEVERLCDRIAILHAGNLVAAASMTEVLSARALVPYVLDLPLACLPSFSTRLVKGTRLEGNRLTVSGRELQEVLESLTRAGIKPDSIRPLSSAVEAYFLQAIGQIPASLGPEVLE